jgi:hypothetical protein
MADAPWRCALPALARSTSWYEKHADGTRGRGSHGASPEVRHPTASMPCRGTSRAIFFKEKTTPLT